MNKLCIALATAGIAIAAIPAAHAQAAGDLVMRVRAISLEANKSTLSVGEVSINDKWLPEVDFTYYFSPNLAAELVLTYPQKQDVLLNGNKLGTLKHLPPVLSAQYHFTDFGAFKPYLGAGVNYTRFSRVDLAGGAVTVDKNSFGLALQAGLDYAIDNKWSLNLDIKKVQIRTDVALNGAKLGTFKIDPTLYAVGVGYKF